MNNAIGEAAQLTRFNTNRSEFLKGQKCTGKTANDSSQQLASCGFDSSQISSALDKIRGNLQHRPWEDTDCCEPSFESPIKPSIDLKPINKPATPISIPSSLIDIIKLTIENPVKPLPGFPPPGKPIGSPLFHQPEVELADPGLTNVHEEHNNKFNTTADDIKFKDIDGDIEVDGITLEDVEQGFIADCYLCQKHDHRQW